MRIIGEMRMREVRKERVTRGKLLSQGIKESILLCLYPHANTPN
jgi:hypothetical protein